MSGPGTRVFTAAVVQMRSGTEPHANVEAFDALVREAARAGADYVQTPEMTGLVQQHRRPFFETVRPAEDDPLVARAAALAKELGIVLHVGSTAVRLSDTEAANRAFVFGPAGERLATYDKVHMFDVDLDDGETWRESAVYRPGEEAVAFEALGARVALTICYDVRFPHLYRDHALDGATVLTAPACFTRQTGRAHWHVLQRARAIENGAWMISAAQGGDMADGRTCYGHSLVVSPWGEVVAEVAGEEPGVALAEIDPAAALAARTKVPNLRNARAYRFPEQREAAQ